VIEINIQSSKVPTMAHFFHISRQIDVLDEAKEVYRGEDGSQLTKVCSWTERTLDGFSVGGGK